MSTKIKTEWEGTWKNWIHSNIKRDCDKNEIFKILLNNNFDYNLIKKELNIDYEDTYQIFYNKNNKHKNPYYISIPNAIKIDTDKMQIYTLDNFLNDDECQKIINISKKYLTKSTVTDNKLNRIVSDFRTSKTCFLSEVKNNKDFINNINNKICEKLGINPDFSEKIQVQNYNISQQFKSHTDFFTPNTKEYENNGKQGNRTWTFMVYLNNVEEGGCTFMSKINKKFYPKKGQAVIWNNLNENGSINYNTLHSGEPIIKGEKWIITKWFRQKSINNKGNIFLYS